jgi:hypothetical protein
MFSIKNGQNLPFISGSFSAKNDHFLTKLPLVALFLLKNEVFHE